MISAIVLAAGLARRFGSAKVLALYEGKSLVRHVVDCVAGAGVAETLVVVPRLADYERVLADTGARLVINERVGGMSSSLVRALAAIDPRAQAVLVVLGDQPTIERGVVEAVIREWRNTRAQIVAPNYRGERGHPVLFDVAVFPELRRIKGDRGARNIIEREPTRVRFVNVDRPLPRDVDTPEDLATLVRARHRSE